MRMRLIQVLTIVLVGGAAWAASHDRYYYSGKTAIPLVVDEQRVAVRGSAASVAIEGWAPQEDAGGIAGWTVLRAADAGADVREAVAAVAAGAPQSFVTPVFIDEWGEALLLTRQVIVGFEAGVDAETQAAVLAPLGVSIAADYAGLPDTHLVQAESRNGWDVLAATNRIAERQEVRFAEPDFAFTARRSSTPPNDTLFGIQWALENTGQDGGTAGFDVRAREAWEVTLGDPNIILVVLDVGVQLDHPDLFVALAQDFTTDAGDGGPQNECDIHGTWVAGSIGALRDNGLGVSGLAPGCTIATARIGISNTPTCTLSWSGQLSWTLDALTWAESIGARITNNSNAYNVTSTPIREKYEQLRTLGMVHFASAGNDDDTGSTWPARLAAVNSVAATNRNGERAFFSNFGSSIFVAAPGEDVFTTDRTGTDGKVDDDYASVDGTSFASPLAAAAAGLILSILPDHTAAEVESAIRLSAADLGVTNLGGGLLDARAALELAAVIDSWIQLADVATPPAVSNAAMTYDPVRAESLLFGGLAGFSSSRETWAWDGGWSRRATTGPAPRFGHAMVYDAARDQTVLFGGFVGASGVNDTWVWDGTAWSLLGPSCFPPPRYLHAMAYDAARGEVVLFGGIVNGTDNAETWVFDGATWTQRLVAGPSARSYHAMTYDAARERVVLYGGASGSDETWVWEGAAWSLVSTEGPGERERHVLAYDAERERVLTFGGIRGADELVDTWEWDGLTWRIVSDLGPVGRSAAASTFDAARGLVLLFGGFTDAQLLGDTWAWRVTPPEIVQQPDDARVFVGQAATFDVVAEGLGPVTFQWLRDGAPLSDDATYTGSETDTLTVSNVTPELGGSFAVVVTDLRRSIESETAVLSITAFPPGDMNCDGLVNAADIGGFVDAIVGSYDVPGCSAQQADTNGDGAVNAGDIESFVAAVIGG